MLPLAITAGCSSHPRYYADAEYSVETYGFFESQGHFAVYYPAEIKLDFPGYVVGIETADRSRLLPDGDPAVRRLVDAGSSMMALADLLRNGKRTLERPDKEDRIPFVSHVLRYRGNPAGTGNCALYSVYQSPQAELMDFCDARKRPTIPDITAYRSAFHDSWKAIDALAATLREEAASGRYTHLIVAMMGWRTAQEEAIRNFNSLMHSIQAAASEGFRPLFIGITWVAPWAGRWFDPLVEALAYANNAEMADTLGLTWLGVLTDEVVLPLSDTMPTIFLTHSFGTRASTTAICVGPVILRSPDFSAARPPGAIDFLFGFQAAFSLQRFREKRLIFFYEDVHFPNDCDRARSIVLTTSQYDTATKAILWADLAGNYRYFRRFCRANAGTLASCASVDEAGRIEGELDTRMKVLYFDASRLIRYRAPGSDGGSHSDIFRPPMGRFIWSLIAKPPATGQATTQHATMSHRQ